MIPETAVSLLAFLLLLSPGLIFEWLRRSHRPSYERSAFEEISTVVLASLVLSTIALVGVATINALLAEPLVSVWAWIRQGDSAFQNHPRRSVATIGAVMLTAWGLAIGANWVLCQPLYRSKLRPRLRSIGAITDDAEVTRHSAWWSLLRERVPETSKSVWMSIEFKDGRQLTGVFHGYDTEGDSDARVLVLRSPLTMRPAGGDSQPLDSSVPWQLLVVPMREVHTALLLYNDKAVP